jgi:hypothetical protein
LENNLIMGMVRVGTNSRNFCDGGRLANLVSKWFFD